MFKKIKKYSPKEVYVGAFIFYLLFFLNSAELLSSRIRISDIFETRHSIIYGLIRGIGDDHIRYDTATIFYWSVLVIFVGLIAIKGKKISNWLWDN